jgi:hypothetical protein
VSQPMKTIAPIIYADPEHLEKASLYVERHREIISDPLNLLINRVPEAGYVDPKGFVILHNGNRVPLLGAGAYYSDFSDILVLNRGVHEPLEEFCFQSTLSRLGDESPLMIELGAYWSHYSMWLLSSICKAKCIMVEPDETALECGRSNFRNNNYQGEFIKDFVGISQFELDVFIKSRGIPKINILHADIQGLEVEMLEGACDILRRRSVDYLFISTHSDELHRAVEVFLKSFDYRIEVSSGYLTETTSTDGFILASSRNLPPVFKSFSPLGRLQILNSDPSYLIRYLGLVQRSIEITD